MEKESALLRMERIEEAFHEQNKTYEKLNEQSEMFHKWIMQTKESISNLQSGWQSEESNSVFNLVSTELYEIEKKNLKYAEDIDQEKAHALESYEFKIKEINEEIKRENKEVEENGSI